jgi:hypothetical protein|tara:strand:- start:562 stop:1005 length:444 start_codon:yes stop_codon:yes gene_type:complete
MDIPSEMRVKLARFIEQRRGRTDATNIICNSCLEKADKIAMEGGAGPEWDRFTVSESLARIIDHSSCEQWIRLCLWLQGILDTSYVPWNEIRTKVKRRVNLFVENEWRNILFLTEEEMIHMTRAIIYGDNHGWSQNMWEEKWRKEMV